jgi:hypothetical protein
MGTEANQRRLSLNCPGGEQNLLTPLRVGPLLAQRPARAFDPVDGRRLVRGLAGGLEQAGTDAPACTIEPIVVMDRSRTGLVIIPAWQNRPASGAA